MAKQRYEDEDDGVDSRPAKQISNNLPLAIFTTLCCCLPLGVVAIIQAAKVNGLVSSGQYREAQEAADSAKKFATYGIIAGIIVNILAAVAQFALAPKQ